MAKTITGEARRELVRAVGERYRVGTKAEKRRILDEFVMVTGYHRKHAIRLLNRAGAKADGRRKRSRAYDEAVREALVILWEASDRVCGKRHKPLLPVLVSALERHGHLDLNELVREKLLRASASTIDRLLAEPRRVAGRRRRPNRSVSAVRRSVPVRTFADWNEPAPGYMEGDLVAHCKGNASGSFVQTLVLTDIASGWTECAPLVFRAGTLIVEAMERVRLAMPFPLRGFDTDNGGEFLNETVLGYCKDQGIEFTRSRPYQKNDQAWVEQKNGAIVRRFVGYRRLEGVAAAGQLSRLCAAARLFVNFFQPSFKLKEKTRIGARVVKRYHPPQTPCARLLESELVPEVVKERLRSVAMRLDPLRLLDEIRDLQREIVSVAEGNAPRVGPRCDADLEQFLESLSTAWRAGEVRPTHRKPPPAPRNWRTRKDPFEEVWPTVLDWLNAEPDRTAKELFHRLQAQHPGDLRDGQLRTLQRRVKEWRSDAARKLVFAGYTFEGEAPRA